MGTMIGGISVFFFQAEDGIRDYKVTGVQTCALPILITLAKAGAGSALMAELKTPTSPLVLSKPQTHAARVALPHARPGSRLWWGVGGLGVSHARHGTSHQSAAAIEIGRAHV